MRNILFPAPEATKFLHGIVVGSHDECEVIEATLEGKFFYLQKEQKEIFFKGYYFTGVACAFTGVGMGVLIKKNI